MEKAVQKMIGSTLRRYAKTVLFSIAVTASLARVAWGEQRYASPEFLGNLFVHYHEVQTPFSGPLSFEASMGSVFGRNFYFGGVGEFTLGSRTGAGVTETLSLIHVGAEIGLTRQFPKHFFLLAASVFYPVLLQISDSLGSAYISPSVLLTYRVRFLVGIRVTSYAALTLGVSYKLQNYGTLTTAAGASFPALDLTGIAVSAGFTFTL
jgi:hypothetical protein